MAITDYQLIPPDERPWVRLEHEGQPASGEVRARWRDDGVWFATVTYSLDVPPATYPDRFSAQLPYDALEHVPEPASPADADHVPDEERAEHEAGQR